MAPWVDADNPDSSSTSLASDSARTGQSPPPTRKNTVPVVIIIVIVVIVAIMAIGLLARLLAF